MFHNMIKNTARKSDELETASRWGFFLYVLILIALGVLSAITSFWVVVIGGGLMTFVILLLVNVNLHNPKFKKHPLKKAFAQFKDIGELLSYLPGPN